VYPDAIAGALLKRDSKAAQQVVPEAPKTMPPERPAVMFVGERV